MQRRRGKSSDALPGRPRLVALRTRKAVEGAAMRVCNLLLSGTITAQDAQLCCTGVDFRLDEVAVLPGSVVARRGRRRAAHYMLYIDMLMCAEGVLLRTSAPK
jgi:hypothetical protein